MCVTSTALFRCALPGKKSREEEPGAIGRFDGLALAGHSALPVRFSSKPVGRSALRRIGESIWPRHARDSAQYPMERITRLGGVSARSVVLDLSLVPRGRYELRVEVKPAQDRLRFFANHRDSVGLRLRTNCN